KLIAIMFAVAVATAGAVAPVTGAFAKITPTDVSCTNGGGNQPGGQQPSCTGSGLTQNTENQNPAGQAPPGQN
ncbi:MAG TPA: hypothetical protein VFA92_17760, partial [Candidatus Binatia bacterium]|nr:hypothetical protein [Candidatus Binatia bacterium]